MQRLYKALCVSLSGFLHAARTQTAFRQELLLTAAGILIASIADVSNLQRLLLIGSLLLLLIVELLNTAIEVTINRIGAEIHPLSKQAKDLGSAAVFVTLLLTTFTWGMVFLG
jgi:diacylglycerol kinase (ATP)